VEADCIFCHIVEGEAPASLIHRDELVSVFLVNPRFDGDGFEISAAAWRDPPPLRDALDRQADAIRAAMKGSN